MIEILSDKKVKIRKDRQCMTCLRLFKKESHMHCQSSVYDGNIGSWYRCLTCQELFQYFEWDRDEGIGEGAIKEIMYDHQFSGTPEEFLIYMKKEKAK